METVVLSYSNVCVPAQLTNTLLSPILYQFCVTVTEQPLALVQMPVKL